MSDVHDAERVAAFNAPVHQDEAIGVFARWKLSGTHPAVTFSDCLFVEDTQSEVVSSLCLIPQTRTYEGIPLPVGEVALVGTHPAYRGRGLIRAQAIARDYTKLCFALPQSHPLLAVARHLGSEPERQYAWQVRVVDCAAFLRHIGPALEKRLARSPLAGFSGCLDVNTMPLVLRLEFAQGRLTSVVEVQQPQEQATLRMPPLLLTQLLLGYRNCRRLMDWSLDAWVYPQVRPLVDMLFPETKSFVYPAT